MLDGVAGSSTPATIATTTERGRLGEACREFEALFLGMLLREMRSSLPRGGMTSGGAAGELFDSLWADEVARLAAQSGPLGIAQMVWSALTDTSQPRSSAT